MRFHEDQLHYFDDPSLSSMLEYAPSSEIDVHALTMHRK